MGMEESEWRRGRERRGRNSRVVGIIGGKESNE